MIDSYFEKLARINATLDRRYDEIKSGQVKPISADEVLVSAAQERGTSRARMNEFAFHPEAEVDLIEIWDFVAEDSVDAADRVRDNIFSAIRGLVLTPNHCRELLTFGVVPKEPR